MLALLLVASSAHAQVGFDRPGSDYSNFVVRPADPALCASRCEREGRCRAWTFQYPTPDNPNGVCWLKNTVPTRTKAPCCVSGVRGAGVIEPRGGPVEYSIDRYGGDLRNLELPPELDRQCVQGRVRGRQQMPRMDLPAARLRGAGGALLPQESSEAATPAAVLHFGGRAVS